MHDGPKVSKELSRNLFCLGRTQAALASRVCMYASSDHLVGSPLKLKLHRSAYPLMLKDDVVDGLVGQDHCGDVLVFGVGTGELVLGALKANPEARIIAWDRDPMVLRAAMAAHDFTLPMKQGRLIWSLCEDLIDLLEEPPAHRILHPLLAQVYRSELHMLDLDVDAPRVLMCAGGLFIDDVAERFEAHGMGVFSWNIAGMSPAALDMVAKKVAPDFVFAINYSNGLAEACAHLDLPLLVWEIDPSTDGLHPVGGTTEHVHIHTYRQENVARFQSAGFAKVSYTPLAANIVKRSPSAGLVPDGPELCFVGASMVDQAKAFRGLFLDGWVKHHRGSTQSRAQGAVVLEGILAAQRTRPRQYVIPTLLDRHLRDVVAAMEGDTLHDPVAMVGEMAAAERRLNVIARLGKEGISVWGDPGWRAVESHGVTYRGFAGHHHQLTEIYRAGKIHVDVNRLYQLDIVPMRVFDILACGGFLIAEYSPALAELFDVGRELETWDSVDELVKKVRYYKAHPEEAQYIAAKGLIAVQSRHSMAARLFQMLNQLPQKPAHIAAG